MLEIERLSTSELDGRFLNSLERGTFDSFLAVSIRRWIREIVQYPFLFRK